MKFKKIFEEQLDESRIKTDHVANMQKMAAEILKETNEFTKRVSDIQMKPLYGSPNQKELQNLFETKIGKEFIAALNKFSELGYNMHLWGKRMQKASRQLKIVKK